MVFTSKYGVVGLAVVQKEFIAEGINEAGLSAGLFFFPQYGGYEQYDPAQSDRTLADLQLVAWILTQFSTIDQVKAAIASVRVVGLEPSSVGCRISTRTKSAYSPMPPVSSGSSPI